MAEIKLDNPVWHSLVETHAGFCIDYGHLKCYDPDMCPFGAVDGNKSVENQLVDYASRVENFFIVGQQPEFSDALELKKKLICEQMVIRGMIKLEPAENIVQLNGQFDDAVFALVNEVQPGYFKKKTLLLGDYYGIFKNGSLVAVTGERMQMNDFIEVSAVVTHPGYTGHGYAKQLIAHTVNNIFNKHKIPFLHVAETNTPAITLYQKLGFDTRRKISFWNFLKMK